MVTAQLIVPVNRASRRQKLVKQCAPQEGGRMGPIILLLPMMQGKLGFAQHIGIRIGMRGALEPSTGKTWRLPMPGGFRCYMSSSADAFKMLTSITSL